MGGYYAKKSAWAGIGGTFRRCATGANLQLFLLVLGERLPRRERVARRLLLPRRGGFERRPTDLLPYNGSITCHAAGGLSGRPGGLAGLAVAVPLSSPRKWGVPAIMPKAAAVLRVGTTSGRHPAAAGAGGAGGAGGAAAAGGAGPLGRTPEGKEETTERRAEGGVSRLRRALALSPRLQRAVRQTCRAGDREARFARTRATAAEGEQQRRTPRLPPTSGCQGALANNGAGAGAHTCNGREGEQRRRTPRLPPTSGCQGALAKHKQRRGRGCPSGSPIQRIYYPPRLTPHTVEGAAEARVGADEAREGIGALLHDARKLWRARCR